MSSASGILMQSNSKRRYVLKDVILREFLRQKSRHDGSTSIEIALSLLQRGDITELQVADVHKRVSELKKDSCGYVSEIASRICTKTNVQAGAYKISDRGVEYLRAKGFSINNNSLSTKDNINSGVSMEVGRSFLDGIRNKLA